MKEMTLQEAIQRAKQEVSILKGMLEFNDEGSLSQAMAAQADRGKVAMLEALLLPAEAYMECTEEHDRRRTAELLIGNYQLFMMRAYRSKGDFDYKASCVEAAVAAQKAYKDLTGEDMPNTCLRDGGEV